jgi:hypothetical protein
MSKPTITKVFFGSLIAIVGGVFVMAAGFLLSLGDVSVVTSGQQVTSVEVSSRGTAMLVVAAAGILAIVAGAIGQLVAWIGAVVNTFHLDDKLWFVLLLVLGLLSFGFVAMLVYVIGGPDGTLAPAARPMSAQGAGA